MESVYNMSKFDLAKKFGCEISEVLDAKSEIITPEKLAKAKVLKGYINMERLQLTDLGSVEVIVGDSFGFEDRYGRVSAQGLLISADTKNLDNLKVVYGNVSSVENAETNFGGIKNIYGNVYLNHTNTKSLGKIKNIYGILSVDFSKIESLGNRIKHIDDIMATTDIMLNDFGSLESFDRIYLGTQKRIIPTQIHQKPVFSYDENEMLYTTKEFIIGARIENLAEAEKVLSAYDYNILNHSVFNAIKEADWMANLANLIRANGYDISFVTNERKETIPMKYFDKKTGEEKTINIFKSITAIKYRISSATMLQSIKNQHMNELITKVSKEFVQDEKTGKYNRIQGTTTQISY